MKSKLFLAIALFTCKNIFCQDPKSILKKAYAKCQSIQNGHYEMSWDMKYLSEKDTVNEIFYCDFKKLKDDSIYSSAFHYYSYLKPVVKYELMYTGSEFVTISGFDSTATIMSKSRWAKEIKASTHNHKFYSPLTNKNSWPLPQDSDFTDKKRKYTLLAQEKINEQWCYHILEQIVPENNPNDRIKRLKAENHFWILKNEFIPVRYSHDVDLVVRGDTMHEYERKTLKNFRINDLKDEKVLTLKSVLEFYKVKDYVPYKTPDPLKLDSLAPDWELSTLNGEKISLKSMKGNLVLIDFFYKSCYPCMLALSALQSLNEKYKDRGLKVIGIDPYDTKEDDIGNFLAKRGVSYTVLLDGRNTAEIYKVSAYPTMFLIGKTGRIVSIKLGYSEDLEKELEKIVLANL